MGIVQFRHLRSFIFLFIFLSILNSCHFSSKPVSPVLFAGYAMTIHYRILIGEKLEFDKRLQIEQIIEKTFEEIDQIYNKWNPKSEISQLNQLNAGQKKKISPSLAKFFKKIDFFVSLTEGKFDPTIEPIYQLWKKALEQNSIPSCQEIKELQPAIGWNKILIKDGIFEKLDSRTELDFGGVAKGYCVDLIAERLEKAGFLNFFVEWGGEISAKGEHPDKRPWKVFISQLGNCDPKQAIAYVDLDNQALATSGDYYQFWKIERAPQKTKFYCHIIHPLTLFPLEVKIGTVASASLLADDCLTADALAKVLMLFDTPQKAEEWAMQIKKKHPSFRYWITVRHTLP